MNQIKFISCKLLNLNNKSKKINWTRIHHSDRMNPNLPLPMSEMVMGIEAIQSDATIKKVITANKIF